jgi:hypothetical protein
VGWVLPSLTCEIETVLRSAPCVVEDSANQHEQTFLASLHLS